MALAAPAGASFGKSCAGSVCRLNLLLPALICRRLSCSSRATAVPLGKRAQDVLQLARRHGGRVLAGAGSGLAARSNLELEVGCRERELVALDLEQDVGQDRKRMAALDDAADGLQWQKNHVPLYAY